MMVETKATKQKNLLIGTTIGRRILCFITDFMIYMVMVSLLFVGGYYLVITKSNTYVTNVNQMQEDETMVNQIAVTAGLLYLEDELPTDFVRSYAIHLLNEPETSDGTLNDTYYDNFLAYYVTYRNDFTVETSYTVASYNKAVLDAENPNALSRIVFDLRDGDITKPLLLRTDIKTALNAFYIDDSEDQNVINLVRKFANFVETQYQNAIADLIVINTEYRDLLADYAKCNEAITWMISLTAVVIFFITYLAFFVLIPTFLLKKGHKTLGKRLLRLSVVGAGGEALTKGQQSLRILVHFVEYFGMLALVPFALFTTNSFQLPLIHLGNFYLSFFTVFIASAFLMLISLLTALFNKKAQFFHDLAGRSLVIEDSKSLIQDVVIDTPTTKEILDQRILETNKEDLHGKQ